METSTKKRSLPKCEQCGNPYRNKDIHLRSVLHRKDKESETI